MLLWKGFLGWRYSEVHLFKRHQQMRRKWCKAEGRQRLNESFLSCPGVSTINNREEGWRESVKKRKEDSKCTQENLQFNNYCAVCFKDVHGASIVCRNCFGFFYLEAIKKIKINLEQNRIEFTNRSNLDINHKKVKIQPNLPT